jgi:uncharacterized protein (TIGR02001 family)
MKTLASLVFVAAAATASSAFAADMPVKAPPAAVVAAPAWDVVITAALMSDYNFRGISQSNHQPSTQAGFEWRYNWNPNFQGYVGVSGESIAFPNRAAAEVDFYGGIRPTFDKLALDFGVWYYYYPGGQCFNTAALCTSLGGGGIPPGGPVFLPNGNVIKADLSFIEGYAKATYTVNDQLALGLQEWYSPSVLNSGAPGWFTTGNATVTLPGNILPSGIGASVSGDLGYWALGTSDAFYAVAGFPNGIPYRSYWTWDLGMTFTYKVLALDLRYYDTNLNKGDCNAFTSDQTAGGVFSTNINPGGPGSNWCSAAFIAKLTATIDWNTNLK